MGELERVALEAPPLLVVVGPTASGKTALSLELASELGAEIVSCDSMQVYRGMDIGTAKPTAEERSIAPHHLLDVADPDESYSASHFKEEADQAIAHIHARGRVALVTGGTGLYLRALIHGLSPAPPRCDALRAQLQSKADRLGWPALHGELSRVDPQSACRISARDGVRIVRALEVHTLTGVPLSTINSEHRLTRPRYRAHFIGLQLPRAELYRRIEERLDVMLQGGFLGEVESLLGRGYAPELRPMQALGYRQLCRVVQGDLCLEEARSSIATATRNYAKRQETWFRALSQVRWVSPAAKGEVIREAERFLGCP